MLPRRAAFGEEAAENFCVKVGERNSDGRLRCGGSPNKLVDVGWAGVTSSGC